MPRQSARLTLVNDVNFMLYTPFLPEAAAGTLEPRHVVTPLREILKRTYLRLGSIDGHDPGGADGRAARPRRRGRAASLRPAAARARLGLAGAAGAGPRRARGRLQEPRRRDLAAQPRGRDAGGGQRDRGPGASRRAAHLRLRRRRLRRPGGARRAAGLRRRRDGELPARPPARDALGPGRGDRPGAAGDRRRARRLRPARAARARHRHPPRHDAGGGQRRQRPALQRRDAADPHRGLDRRRRAAPEPARSSACRSTSAAGSRSTSTCGCEGMDSVWAIGDCAAAPDPRGGLCPPTAQHAVRQGPVAARNIAAELGVGTPQRFEYRSNASFVNLGRYKAVGRIGGRTFRGFPAWWMARTYHMSQIPGAARKARAVHRLDRQPALPPRPLRGRLDRPSEAVWGEIEPWDSSTSSSPSSSASPPRSSARARAAPSGSGC